MTLVYRIELPDEATASEILNAIAQAGRSDQGWKRVTSKAERMKKTDLEGKCGTCQAFRIGCWIETEGGCAKGHPWGKQSRPACKDYERRKRCPGE